MEEGKLMESVKINEIESKKQYKRLMSQFVLKTCT